MQQQVAGVKEKKRKNKQGFGQEEVYYQTRFRLALHSARRRLELRHHAKRYESGGPKSGISGRKRETKGNRVKTEVLALGRSGILPRRSWTAAVTWTKAGRGRGMEDTSSAAMFGSSFVGNRGGGAAMKRREKRAACSMGAGY